MKMTHTYEGYERFCRDLDDQVKRGIISGKESASVRFIYFQRLCECEDRYNVWWRRLLRFLRLA